MSAIAKPRELIVKRAVFLDRDGVINIDHGYVHKVDDFDYVEGVFEACASLKQMGYLLAVVTNQSGIARGMYSEEQFHTLTEWMDWNFADKGVELDGIYYCPHHADKGVGEYKVDCDCRKPKPGMILSAAQFLKIDLSQSAMVGDKRDDMLAAQAAGIPHRILVRTGKEVTDEAIAAATVVLDSVADVPNYLASL
ncbi:D-glycero-beta-D-manno-heptose 1,7-bisphosphate 7-phosphatase [Shewanella waksmanii]|uniref:D-glycero-beta-D-manno-heptose 1,7-bisphosphate 7-phosphatase n=1 Tax=Shewanella waksmanii TaxID=213783 RepID=UPI003735A9DA